MPIGKVRLGLPVALFSFSLIFGCSSQHKAPTEEARPVKTMKVAAGGNAIVRSFPGKVEASRMVDLAFQVPGVLAKIPVKEGERVSKGAPIAQLRQEEFQARQKARPTRRGPVAVAGIRIETSERKDGI